MPLGHFILGVALLIFGRKLFWVFVGVVGFIAGMDVAMYFFKDQPEWIALAMALGLGCLGILLALVAQTLAIGIAGFLGGGWLAVALMNGHAMGGTQMFDVTYIVGGVIGLILVLSLLDWALIILSSLIGARLVALALPLDPQLIPFSFVVLAVVGIVIQARLMTPTYRIRHA